MRLIDGTIFLFVLLIFIMVIILIIILIYASEYVIYYVDIGIEYFDKFKKEKKEIQDEIAELKKLIIIHHNS